MAALLINRSSDENGGITRKVRKLQCPYIGTWIRDLGFEHLEKPLSIKMMFYDCFHKLTNFIPLVFLSSNASPASFWHSEVQKHVSQ